LELFIAQRKRDKEVSWAMAMPLVSFLNFFFLSDRIRIQRSIVADTGAGSPPPTRLLAMSGTGDQTSVGWRDDIPVVDGAGTRASMHEGVDQFGL
jgi:hypothetical protein